jgi:hypothetical protein
MPSYRYTCDQGHEQIDVVQNYKVRKKFMKCKSCGKRAYWAFGANTQSSSAWPRTSTAMSVHPDQIKEAGDYDHANGVTTEYTKDGDAIYTSKQHQDKHLRLHGYYDRDACYSGVTPTYQGAEG